MRIAIVTDQNAYGTKSYFSLKLAEALERLGQEILFVNLSEKASLTWEDIKAFQDFKPQLSISYNNHLADESGFFFWDYLKIPHLSLLLDPPIYSYHLMMSPLSRFACIDQSHVEWLKKRGFENAFFLAHAADKELLTPPETKRDYDVVFLASAYDAPAAREAWKASFKDPKLLEELFERTLARTQEEKERSFELILDEELERKKLALPLSERIDLTFFIDTILRGEERTRLIQSITHTEVHLFGDIAWLRDYKARSWQTQLGDQKNIIFHPSVSYVESLEILKKSKISLNTNAFFKRGAHERIFAGLMAGSLPVTSHNKWIEENFVLGQELITFDAYNPSGVDNTIRSLLNDDVKRGEIVKAGQKKVLENHTWDHRAKELLSKIAL